MELKWNIIEVGLPWWLSGKKKNLPAMQELVEIRVLSQGVRTIPLRRARQPTPVILKNPMDRGVWQATVHAAAAAKSLQSCPTLCDPIDGSPPGSSVPGILQARTLERVAISFSNAWKWKVKVKSLNRVQLLVTPWTAAYQAPPFMGFSRQEYWNGVPLPSPATVHRAVKNRTWLKWLSMHKLWPIHM